MRKAILLFVVLVVLVVVNAGCSSAPAQKPIQTVAPDSTTASTLKDVQAQVLSLAQQNTAIINAIQKSSQDTDQFRDQVKGSIASLTQVQFRFESWLAEASGRWRLRVLGCPPYRPAGQVGPELVDGRSGVRDSAGADGRSAGAGADAKVAVLTKGVLTGSQDQAGPVNPSGKSNSSAGFTGNPVHPVIPSKLDKGGPTMLQLTIAFLLGCVLSSVVLGILAALHQVLADHIMAKLGVIISWIWAKLVGLISLFKPKTATAPSTPPPAAK